MSIRRRNNGMARTSRTSLDRLNAIPAAQLSPGEQVNAASLPHRPRERTDRDCSIAPGRCRSTATAPSGPTSIARSRSTTPPSYRRYIGRMRDIPRYFDEQIANMRAGLARGFSVPRATLDWPRRFGRHLCERNARNEQLLQAVREHACRPSLPRSRRRFERKGALRSPVRCCPPIASCSTFIRDEYVAQGSRQAFPPMICPTVTHSTGRRCANIRRQTSRPRRSTSWG